MLANDGLWVLGGYLCGSIPFAMLIGRARGVDIRKIGSGNVGAANVTRSIGRWWGLLCLLLDALKGLVPVVAAGWHFGALGNPDPQAAIAWRWLAVAAAAVLGHTFPVWLRFKGGKGVATGLGVLLGLWPLLTLPTLASLATWILLAGLFGYVSLASVGAAVSLPIYLLAVATWRAQDATQLAPFLAITGLLAVLVIARHRGNLNRLCSGTEPKLAKRAARSEERHQSEDS